MRCSSDCASCRASPLADLNPRRQIMHANVVLTPLSPFFCWVSSPTLPWSWGLSSTTPGSFDSLAQALAAAPTLAPPALQLFVSPGAPGDARFDLRRVFPELNFCHDAVFASNIASSPAAPPRMSSRRRSMRSWSAAARASAFARCNHHNVKGVEYGGATLSKRINIGVSYSW